MPSKNTVAGIEVAPAAEGVTATGTVAKGVGGSESSGLVVFLAGHARRQCVGMLSWVGDLTGVPMETGGWVRAREQADEAAEAVAATAQQR